MKSILKGLFTTIVVIGFIGILLFSMKQGYFGVIDTSLDISDPYTRGGFEIVSDGYLVDYWGDEKEIVLPSTIKTISTKAFEGNEDIISITIPNSVEVIEPRAFANCKNLQTVILDANIEVLEYKTFYNCKSLTNITLTNQIEKIGYSAFENCKSLTSVNLPKQLSFIGGKAFKSCILNTIEIPKSLQKVGKKGSDGPFTSSGLSTITFEEGIERIPANLFIGANMSEVTIPATITKIDKNAFAYCKELTKVTLEEGIQEIDKYAFRDCVALETMNLPASLKNISNTVIKNCNKVKFVVVEDSKGHQFVEKYELEYELKK